MILGGTEGDLESWKTEMKQYEKAKRTKKPFGPTIPTVTHVTHKDIKTQETKFNPVLQTYKSREVEDHLKERQEQCRAQSLVNHFKHTQKYDKPYDIINLYPESEAVEPQSKRLKAPLRNNYNIVSNQPLSDFYLKNSELKFTNKPQRKNLKDDVREFDIITGNFKQNNEQKQQQQESRMKSVTQQKYWKTRDYNPVIGTYYDMNKQQQYQEELEKQMKDHGKDVQKKLPPSYIHRQRFIVDPTKQIPQELRHIDQQNRNAKKRYEMRYIVQKEYNDRNIEHQQRQQAILKNHIHDGKVLQDQRKDFNIVSLTPYDMQHKLDLFGKKPLTSTWDKITRLKNNDAPSQTANSKFCIKTSGFN